MNETAGMFEDAEEEGQGKEAEMMRGVMVEAKDVKKKLATGTANLDKLVAAAAALTVTSQAEYDAAKAVVNQMKTAVKEVRNLRLFITRPIDAMKAYFMDIFEKPAQAAEEAIAVLDGKRSAWFAEQERKRIAEQARLDKIARDAEKKERDRIEAERQKAIKKGQMDRAEELAQQKETVFVPAAQAQSAAGKGDVVKMVYTGEITDFAALPDKYKLINEKAVLADIEASKGTITIPGYKYTGEIKVSTFNRGGK